MASSTQTRLLKLQQPYELEPKWQPMLESSSQQVRPRVLRVRLRALTPYGDEITQATQAMGYTAGIWWPLPSGERWQQGSYRCGGMRIRYGSNPGIFREVYADLREGEYNIPPCETASIAAAWWSPLQDYGDDGGWELETAVEIAEGDAIESTPLVLTAGRLIEPGPSVPCYVPPGAYAFDAQAGRATVYVENSQGLYVERDPSTGKWVPPTTPILLGATRALELGTSESQVVTVQFFVR